MGLGMDFVHSALSFPASQPSLILSHDFFSFLANQPLRSSIDGLLVLFVSFYLGITPTSGQGYFWWELRGPCHVLSLVTLLEFWSHLLGQQSPCALSLPCSLHRTAGGSGVAHYALGSCGLFKDHKGLLQVFDRTENDPKLSLWNTPGKQTTPILSNYVCKKYEQITRKILFSCIKTLMDWVKLDKFI